MFANLLFLLLLNVPASTEWTQPIVDLHADLLWQLVKHPDKDVKTWKGQTGLKAWKEGRVGLQILPIFVLPGKSNCKAMGLKELKAFQERVVGKGAPDVVQARTADEARRIFKSGKIAVMLSMEGAAPLAGDIENLQPYVDAGLRILSLTWNDSEVFADGPDAGVEAPRGGLTDEGRQLLAEMEKHRIIADLSHAHWETFWDVVTTIHGPVMASHSNARAVRDHVRNLDDEQLVAIAEKGGVVGLCYHTTFLVDKGRAGLEDFLKHLNHVRWIAGDRVAALGSDFDGGIKPLTGVSGAWDVPLMLEQAFRARLEGSFLPHWARENALSCIEKADMGYMDIPPLAWRPLVPTEIPQGASPAFDRLATTGIPWCIGEKSAPIRFTVEAASLSELALRFRRDSREASEAVEVFLSGAQDDTPISLGSCPMSGARCLLRLPEGMATRSENVLSITFHTASGNCIDVLDIVPIQKIY